MNVIFVIKSLIFAASPSMFDVISTLPLLLQLLPVSQFLDRRLRSDLSVHITHLILYHLTSSQLTSFYPNWEAVSALWSDPVRRGCDQSDKTARPTSFWLVAATANWVASQRTHYHSLHVKWGQVRCDEMRWDESGMNAASCSIIKPLYFLRFLKFCHLVRRIAFSSETISICLTTSFMYIKSIVLGIQQAMKQLTMNIMVFMMLIWVEDTPLFSDWCWLFDPPSFSLWVKLKIDPITVVDDLVGAAEDASTGLTVIFRRLLGITFAWWRITAKILEKAITKMVRGTMNFQMNMNTA